MDASPNHMTIVLIDSHKEDREHWGQRLKISSPDYLVLEATTGEEGLSICRSQQVDCVVLERGFSDMSAFQVLFELVPRYPPEIAVVMLTHSTHRSLPGLVTGNGAQDCLVKSQTSGEDLDRAIRSAIANVGPTKDNEWKSSKRRTGFGFLKSAYKD